MQNFDVIVIGGGASGCICAITAARGGKSVAIIDSSIFPAKKLLVTGNGKCNLTNTSCNNDFYNQNIEKYFKKFNYSQTIEFFEKLGLLVYEDDEHRVYPVSNSAKSVLEVINREINKNNISIYCNETVNKIFKKNDLFEVRTLNKVYFSKKVVIATGGNTMISNIKQFGHSFVTNSPSLVALKTQSTKKLDGIRIRDAMVTATCNNITKKDRGEVLFKENGLSGIVIMNLSTLFARQHKFIGKISINLLPKYSKMQVVNLITIRIPIFDKVSDMFEGIFNKEIAKEIMLRSKIKEDKITNELTENEIDRLANIITNLDFDVCGYYDNNQVYSGGIKLTELSDNLESKFVRGLYFCGEVCDVDGECGGFNLQWAWTSGHIVGESL